MRALAGLVSLVIAGCGSSDEPPITGLRLFENHAHGVSGTFAANGAAIDFAFSLDGPRHAAVIRSADGRPLVESTWAAGAEATIYVGRLTVTGSTSAPPRIAGDTEALRELAALPEARLLQPLRDALAQAGITASLFAAPLACRDRVAGWSWWCNVQIDPARVSR